MAARLTPRRFGEFLMLWLCAWLVAREALLVLFAFHPLKLLFWSGVFVLLLRMWLRSGKSRLIGAGALIAAFLLVCVMPAAKEGTDSPIRKLVAFSFDFVQWLRNAVSSRELPLHARFGTALWMLFLFGGALLAVLLLDTLHLPVTAAFVFCGLFTVLQVAPFVQDRQTSRLLLTLVAVIGCCAWFYMGKRWDASRRTRSYGRWQAGMALLLLPALALTAMTAGLSEMNWRSSRFSGDVNDIAYRTMEWLSRGIGTGGSYENLNMVQLGGDRVETGDARFSFSLDSSLELQNRVYLRSAVFDRYTGYHWQRTLDTEENAAAYAEGTAEFRTVLQSEPAGGDTSKGWYVIKDVAYYTSRIPTPLGVTLLASARLSDIEALRQKSGDASDFGLVLTSGADGNSVLCGHWNPVVKIRDGVTYTDYDGDWLPAVPMTASIYGEVTSAESIRKQYVGGQLTEGAGAFFSDGEQKLWDAAEETTLAAVKFSDYGGKEQAPYLDLPVTLPADVRALAGELRLDTPYATAQSIRGYLRTSYSYSLTPATTDQDFVSSFLFDIKEGYCTSFASAMTVLARACGIPARYVEGYAVEHGRAVAGTTVTDIDRHAWSELYFPGVGWLTFDATTYSAASSMPLAREELDLTPYEPEETPKEQEPEKPEPDEPENQEPVEEDPGAVPGGEQKTPHVGLMVLLSLVLLAAALYLFYRLRLAAWTRAQERYRKDPKSVRAAFSELARGAAALGCTHTPTQTVGDYFAALAPMGLSENSRLRCARAAQAVDTAVYGERYPEELDLRALAEILEGVYRRLVYLRGKIWLVLWWRKGKNN